MNRRFGLVCVLFFLVAATGCRPQQIELTSNLAIGDSFPDAEGTGIDGEPISMAQYRGKVVLVDFFGDW